MVEVGVSAREQGRPPTCVYCHDVIVEQLVACGDCGATYHAPCREELRGCATLGCQTAAPRRPRRVEIVPPRTRRPRAADRVAQARRVTAGSFARWLGALGAMTLAAFLPLWLLYRHQQRIVEGWRWDLPSALAHNPTYHALGDALLWFLPAPLLIPVLAGVLAKLAALHRARRLARELGLR